MGDAPQRSDFDGCSCECNAKLTATGLRLEPNLVGGALLLDEERKKLDRAQAVKQARLERSGQAPSGKGRRHKWTEARPHPAEFAGSPMETALNPAGQRVHAASAFPGAAFRCPVCRVRVRHVSGPIQTPHFRHWPRTPLEDRRILDCPNYAADQGGQPSVSTSGRIAPPPPAPVRTWPLPWRGPPRTRSVGHCSPRFRYLPLTLPIFASTIT